MIPFSCQYHLDPTDIGKFNINDDLLEDTILGDNIGAAPVESDEGSSVFNGIKDYLAANIGSDFGDNGVVREHDKKVEELKAVNMEKLESVSSPLQTNGIVDESRQSSLEELRLYLIKEFVVRVLEIPYIPGENCISLFKWIFKKHEFSLTRATIGTLYAELSVKVVSDLGTSVWVVEFRCPILMVFPRIPYLQRLLMPWKVHKLT